MKCCCLPHRLAIVFLIIVLATLAGCIPPFSADGDIGALNIPINQAHVTIAWDHTPGRIPGNKSEITHFRLYVRDRRSGSWEQVAQVRARDNPTFLVSADAVLGSRQKREIVFGVSSLNRRGSESSIHSSTDYEARPHGGWYVTWTRP